MPKSDDIPRKQSQTSQPQQTNVNKIDTTATQSHDEESEVFKISYQQLCDQLYNSNYDSNSDDYVAAISSNAAHQLEPLNAKIQYRNIIANWMIDSGSVCSIVTKTLAIKILNSTPSRRWIASTCEEDHKTFSYEPIKKLGKIETTVVYNGWICEDAFLTVVADGHKLIMGRDLSSRVFLAVVKQQAKRTECINDIDNSACKVKQAILLQFPDIVLKIGLSKTHVDKSKFHQKFTAKHQKSCRVSINLQPRVTDELDRLQEEGHIEKLSRCSGKDFISPTGITAK